MQLSLHPAPGNLGELLPGWFAVPQDPITAPITYTRGIGEILPGSYTVPQNPVANYATGVVRPIATSPNAQGMVNGAPVGGDCGCGCGGSGGCGNGPGMGMGDISADFTKLTSDLTSGNFMTAIQDPIFGIPAWGYLAGIALVMFAGGERHSYAGRGRRAYRAARQAF